MEVPVADVEIDVDIEYDLDNRVYMWGARLRRGTDDSTAQYSSWLAGQITAFPPSKSDMTNWTEQS